MTSHLPLQRSTVELRFVLATALAVVAVASALALRLATTAAGERLPLAPPPTSPAIEERWGIRVTQLGLAADGGMVDLRYQVIDPDKALPLIEKENANPQDQPPMALVAEDTAARVTAIALMPPKHDLESGRTYFLLFHNTGNAIAAGRPVTLVIGDLRLEHIIVR